MALDFKRASDLALSHIEEFLPGGQWKGHEYFVRNPRRNDRKAGSFRINRDGCWSDFATGDKGGDGVSLWSYVFDVSQGEAAKQILDRYEGSYIKPAPMKDDVRQIIPAPADAGMPRLTHPEYGNPTARWEYRGENGALLFVVARYNTQNGKAVIPFTYCEVNGVRRWKSKAPESPRPLYGLDGLKDGLPILLVEGEKCAEIAGRFLKGSYTVMTWQGGSKAVGKSDWRPLHGRDVVIWPDADQPGVDAAAEIEKLLRGSATVRILPAQKDKPEGWDVADAIAEGWTTEQLLEFVAPVQREKPPFRAIGYYERTYYFLSGRTSNVIPISSSEMRKNQFLTLAPLSFWETNFPGKTGPQWDLVTDTLIGMCQEAGPYDPQRIRGRGVWTDEGRTVIHNGDSVTVNGTTMDVDQFQSRYIYERRPAINSRKAAPITREQGKNVVDLFFKLNWDRPGTAYLAAGWCAISSICGTLNWRPHTWLTGPAGSGKSWVLQNLVKPLLGDGAMFRLGKSTEAGLRQDLLNDALPVVIDEAESDEKGQAETLQAILTLMRQASSEGDVIVKGTTHGRPIKFKISSAFMLSSIGVAVHHHADDSRVTTLSLVTDNTETGRARFSELQRATDSLLTEEFCAGFRARVMGMSTMVRENAKILSRVVAKRLSSQRQGDQMGTLLAGAFALMSDEFITEEQAERWIATLDFTEEEAKREFCDEETCLQTILQSTIRLDNRDITVGEVIACAAQVRTLGGEIYPPDCEVIIKRHGIRYNEENKNIYFAASHNGLKTFLKNTPWQYNYSRLLRRLPGASSGPQTRFTDGVVQRTTIIPLDRILKIEQK